MRFKRGFSDPAFAAGGDSEYDRALELAQGAILEVVDADFREELTEKQRKFIAHQAALRVMSAINQL